jgi:hypothetical protein
MSKATGGCLCGQVRFEAHGEPDRVGMCHCLDCRKHHGAVFYAAAIYPAAAVTISGKYQSYQGRAFCPVCGSSVFARTGDELEIHLGALDEPNQFEPSYETWTDRRETWLPDMSTTQKFAKDRDAPED